MVAASIRARLTGVKAGRQKRVRHDRNHGKDSLRCLFAASPAYAHCDGRDGPVVAAARQALDANDVKPALIWVARNDEGEIREAFRKARAVRGLDPAARTLADDYFYETLVRVHRAGEGAPYTGLKPAGGDPGPAIAAGDKALVDGSVEPVLELLTHQVREDIGARFREVQARKGFRRDDVAAGQEYVKAYVEYIHAVERVHAAAAAPAHGTAAEAEPARASTRTERAPGGGDAR